MFAQVHISEVIKELLRFVDDTNRRQSSVGSSSGTGKNLNT